MSEPFTEYKTTIGLEVHAELSTKTKMFCDSKNDPDEERPNVNICPVCMGHPGTLPVINKEAVKHVLKVGVALKGKLADFTEFDRKNYFYPDIPKGYQISQYKYPLVSGGLLNGVSITRVHLEEDTARSSHDTGDVSLVDFNRAGLPLMELVTEPVIHSGKEAGDFARELQLLLRYLGVSKANMEKGEMRVEANISVSKDNTLGTKVEVKNLNSFRSVERAVAFEVTRHINLLEQGEKIIQETRGWDENKQSTFSQRAKEDSHDYRYFPDPDLPKLHISEIPEFSIENLKKELPELPGARRSRYQTNYQLTDKEAAVFVEDVVLGNYFESILAKLGTNKGKVVPISLVKSAVNYLLTDYLGLLKNSPDSNLNKISPEQFAELIVMIGEGKLSSRAAKDIIVIMYNEGGMPGEIAISRGLIQKNDEGELKKIMSEIIVNSPKVVADYKGGKLAALQSIVGQGMKATKGGANPEVLKKITLELLG